MKKTYYVSAIIVAAGSGTRMGGISKPMLQLGGKTVIERVVSIFSNCPSVNEIIVVCRENDNYGDFLRSSKPLSFVTGGLTRSQSVYHGIKKASNADIVCIHDCARPFITVEDIEKLIDEAILHGASCASNKMRDTVKYRSEEEKLFYTPKRDNLITVQTPQVFKKDIWTVSYYKAIKDGISLTDDTTAVEHSGFNVSYVETSSLNMKLTDANDVKIAKAICFLQERNNLQ